MQRRLSGKEYLSAGMKPASISGAAPFTWPTRYGIFHFVWAGGLRDERRWHHVRGYKLQGDLSQTPDMSEQVIPYGLNHVANDLILVVFIFSSCCIDNTLKRHCMLVCHKWEISPTTLLAPQRPLTWKFVCMRLDWLLHVCRPLQLYLPLWNVWSSSCRLLLHVCEKKKKKAVGEEIQNTEITVLLFEQPLHFMEFFSSYWVYHKVL